MRYFGSKSSTVEHIYKLVTDIIPSGTICDPFGGIGIVGAYFKRKGYRVLCGDILTSAHYFQIARIERNRTPSFKRLRQALKFSSVDEVVASLNQGRGRDGWFANEYGTKRKFFTTINATRINECRLKINKWWNDGLLSLSEHAVLLASLINCMDKVANTAGTYYAYLKTWYRKASKPFHFELLRPTGGNPECRAFLAEARDVVAKVNCDVLYLDPPYNQRSYSKYYHLPETIARGEAPRVYGKSGIPHVKRPDSDFNSLSKAKKALGELLTNANFKLLVFHYSDNGIISHKEISAVLEMFGRPEEFVINTKGYTTAQNPRDTTHRLFLLEND